MEQTKVEIETVEHCARTETMDGKTTKKGALLMRSNADDLSIWQSVRQYKSLGIVAMAAAFSASLDGYRMETPSCFLAVKL
jgi:SP family general alpha glucoside:H+ symporter-like MFS transporter